MDKFSKAGIGLFVFCSTISSAAFAEIITPVVGALPIVTLDQINAVKKGCLASDNLKAPPKKPVISVPPVISAPKLVSDDTQKNNVNINTHKNIQQVVQNASAAADSNPHSTSAKSVGDSHPGNRHTDASTEAQPSVNHLIAINKNDVHEEHQVSAHPQDVQLSTGTVSTLDLHGDQLIHFAREIDNQDNAKNASSASAASTNGSDHPHVTVSSQVVHEVLDNMVSMVGAAQSEAAAINQGGQVVLGAIKQAVKSDEFCTAASHSEHADSVQNIPPVSAISTTTPSENINHAVETLIANTNINTENNAPVINTPTINTAMVNNSSVNTALITTPSLTTIPIVTSAPSTPSLATTIIPTATPTVAPTMTPTVTPVPVVVTTPVITAPTPLPITTTPTIAPTVIPTVAPTVTPTITPVPAVIIAPVITTPTITPSITTAPTIAPTVVLTVTPTVTPTITPVPAVVTAPVITTPAITPTVTPIATPTINPNNNFGGGNNAVNTNVVNNNAVTTNVNNGNNFSNSVIETGGIRLLNTGLEKTSGASVVVGQVVQTSGNAAEVDTTGMSHELVVGDNVHLGGKFVFTGGTGNLEIKSFSGEIVHVVA